MRVGPAARDDLAAGLAAALAGQAAPERGEVARAPVLDRAALELAEPEAEPADAAAVAQQPAPADGEPPDAAAVELGLAALQVSLVAAGRNALADARRAGARVDAVLGLHLEARDSPELALPAGLPDGLQAEPAGATPAAAPAAALPAASPEPGRVAPAAEQAARQREAQHWTVPPGVVQQDDARRERVRRARDTKWQVVSRPRR